MQFFILFLLTGLHCLDRFSSGLSGLASLPHILMRLTLLHAPSAVCLSCRHYTERDLEVLRSSGGRQGPRKRRPSPSCRSPPPSLPHGIQIAQEGHRQHDAAWSANAVCFRIQNVLREGCERSGTFELLLTGIRSLCIYIPSCTQYRAKLALVGCLGPWAVGWPCLRM